MRRLLNAVIWTYPDDTPDECLLRAARRSYAMVSLCGAAWVAMCSAMLEVLLSHPGWWRVFWFSVLVPAGGLAALSTPLALVFGIRGGEAARLLRRRGSDERICALLDSFPAFLAGRLMIYFVSLMLVANVIGRVPALRAAAAVMYGLLLLAGLLGTLRRWLRLSHATPHS